MRSSTNRHVVHVRFPALTAVYTFLLQTVIGSFRYVRPVISQITPFTWL